MDLVTRNTRLYHTSAAPPKLYGLPKIHKIGTQHRPIVPSRGSIAYGVAKELDNFIRPIAGQSPHHIRNAQLFVDYIHKVKLEPGKVITSYDIKAQFISVPVDPSIAIAQEKLQQNPLLSQRISMSIPQIVSLLEFCLKDTYFLFQDKYYKWVHGTAMGFPISPLIANLFTEEFEVKAINSAPIPHPYGSGL